MTIPILFIVPGDDTAILTNHHALKVDRQSDPPALTISATLADFAAEELNDSGLFGDLELPDTEENPFLDFEVRAHFSARPELCARYAELITGSDDEALMQAYYDGIDEEGDAPSPLHDLSNYELNEWEITETMDEEDRELARLAAATIEVLE